MAGFMSGINISLKMKAVPQNVPQLPFGAPFGHLYLIATITLACIAGSVAGALECDHVIPVSRGGKNHIENLATACFKCNRSKNDNLLSEWVGANV
jgi:5-methylcytosine-specific restriction endonuclease McrA